MSEMPPRPQPEMYDKTPDITLSENQIAEIEAFFDKNGMAASAVLQWLENQHIKKTDQLN